MCWVRPDKPDDLERELNLLFLEDPKTAQEIYDSIMEYDKNTLPLIVKETQLNPLTK